MNQNSEKIIVHCNVAAGTGFGHGEAEGEWKAEQT